MKRITKKSKSLLMNSIAKMEKGDYMKFDGTTFRIYNSLGCLIDYIYSYEI